MGGWVDGRRDGWMYNNETNNMDGESGWWVVGGGGGGRIWICM